MAGRTSASGSSLTPLHGTERSVFGGKPGSEFDASLHTGSTAFGGDWNFCHRLLFDHTGHARTESSGNMGCRRHNGRRVSHVPVQHGTWRTDGPCAKLRTRMSGQLQFAVSSSSPQFPHVFYSRSLESSAGKRGTGVVSIPLLHTPRPYRFLHGIASTTRTRSLCSPSASVSHCIKFETGRSVNRVGLFAFDA